MSVRGQQSGYGIKCPQNFKCLDKSLNKYSCDDMEKTYVHDLRVSRA